LTVCWSIKATNSGMRLDCIRVPKSMIEQTGTLKIPRNPQKITAEV
jgi:hypothetical protein